MIDLNIPEGATPLEDIEGLKLSWIKTRNQLNAAEAENILLAYSKYFYKKSFPSKWFCEKELKNIHSNMFGKVWNWAGNFYKGSMRNIGIKFYLIPIQIHNLCKDIMFWLNNNSSLTFIEQSVRIHHKLVQIHPFKNGNGRHARFIGDLYLYSLYGKTANWPHKILESSCSHRKEYIKALKNADSGDYSSLLKIFIKYKAANPSIAEVLTNPFFKNNFSKNKIIETVQNLINFGESPNKLSQNGHHPLQISIRNFPEKAFLLIENDANLYQKDKSNLTPLESAISAKQHAIIKNLQKHKVYFNKLHPNTSLKVDFSQLYEEIMKN